jgi:hypothetical protein
MLFDTERPKEHSDGTYDITDICNRYYFRTDYNGWRHNLFFVSYNIHQTKNNFKYFIIFIIATVLKKKTLLDVVLSTTVKCSVRRFRNIRCEEGNCRMLDVVTFIYGKLAKNINEKYVTVVFSNVTQMLISVTDCDLSIQDMPHMVEGGPFDRMKIVDYRLSGLVFD